MRTAIVPSSVAALALLLPLPALADAVPPPPSDCPEGTIAITDHGGPRCVAVPPTNCPTGWRGQLGGTCSLAPCASDANCQAGEECVEHPVCLQAFEDPFYDYGEEEREQHGMLEPHPSDLLRSPGLLAGPPMPKKRRPVPIQRYQAMNLCSPDVPCAAPGTCQPEKLCVPRGSRALAYRGTNIRPVRVARKTAMPLTASSAEPTGGTAEAAPPGTQSTASAEPTTSAEPTASPKGGPASPSPADPGTNGCAGCATAPTRLPWWGLAALVAGVTAAAVRRRSRRAG